MYRDQASRGFKNDAVYRSGRCIGEARLHRALANKSRKGREAQFGTWVGEEYATLRLLHAAGAAVPRPLARAGQAILMEYVGDAEVPAPPLYRVELTAEEARPPFARLMGEIALWLARRRVHGDRSAYNLLYWQGRLTAIDFPQAADPRANPHADALLARDVDNVRRCVARYGVAADAGRLAADLWRRFLLAAR